MTSPGQEALRKFRYFIIAACLIVYGVCAYRIAEALT